MTTSSPARPVPARPAFDQSSARLYAIFTGITVLLIFVQSITAGTFIEDGLAESSKKTWTDVHGGLAYPIMLFALIAATVAVARLRRAGRIPLLASLLFAASVLQWLTGHAISGLGMSWITPFHVALAFVIYGLAIWLSVRSARLRPAQGLIRVDAKARSTP